MFMYNETRPKKSIICTLFSLVSNWLTFTKGLVSDIYLAFYVIDIVQNRNVNANIYLYLIVKDLLGL